MDIRDLLALRKRRTDISPEEREELRDHCTKCRAGDMCEAMQVYTTSAGAYTFEMDVPDWRKCTWCDSYREHSAKIQAQRARNPELHRHPWEGVAWLLGKKGAAAYHFVRIQWCVSSFQVIVGRVTGFNGTLDLTEELVYHSYDTIE